MQIETRLYEREVMRDGRITPVRQARSEVEIRFAVEIIGDLATRGGAGLTHPAPPRGLTDRTGAWRRCRTSAGWPALRLVFSRREVNC